MNDFRAFPPTVTTAVTIGFIYPTATRKALARRRPAQTSAKATIQHSAAAGVKLRFATVAAAASTAGRDRTVIDELCARHNRPRPTNDRQLAQPRSPQDDRQEPTRGRHPPSHSDWRCGNRVNPPAVGPPEASSVALISRLGQRPSVFRVPLLLGGRPIGSRRPLPRRAPAHSAMHDARRGRQRGRVLAHRRLASAGCEVALRRRCARPFWVAQIVKAIVDGVYRHW